MKPIAPERFDQLVSSFSTLRPILVIGDVGIDKYTLGEVSRISPEAPVPVLEVKKEWPKLGLAANISHNFSTLKIPSSLIGVVGEDAHANKFEGLLEEIGLNTWGLVRDQGRMTTLKERVTTFTQQICRIDYETAHDVDEEIQARILRNIHNYLPTHSLVILQDYGKGLLPDHFCQKIIKELTKKGCMVAVDPYRTRKADQYKGADLIKPNLTEAKALAKSMGHQLNNPFELASFFVQEINIKKVAITIGGDGLCIFDSEKDKKPSIIPTINCEVFDVSGAGDTALAAMTAVLSAGGTLEEAAWLANCASGVVVGKKGTATVSQEELREFYMMLKKELGS